MTAIVRPMHRKRARPAGRPSIGAEPSGQVAIRVPDDVRDRWEAAAAKLGARVGIPVSLSAFIRSAVDRYAAEIERQP
jgi:hypothetical protein